MCWLTDMAISNPIALPGFDNLYRYGKGTFTRGQLVIPTGRSLRGESYMESIISPDGTVIGGLPFITHANWGSDEEVGPVIDIWIKGTSFGAGGVDEYTNNFAVVHHGIQMSPLHGLG